MNFQATCTFSRYGITFHASIEKIMYDYDEHGLLFNPKRLERPAILFPLYLSDFNFLPLRSFLLRHYENVISIGKTFRMHIVFINILRDTIATRITKRVVRTAMYNLDTGDMHKPNRPLKLNVGFEYE